MNACKLGLEGIVSKKLDASYKSGPFKGVVESQKSESPAATRALDGTF
jgi:ATP-dependent DNA ligase